jgi:hypothetical protein
MSDSMSTERAPPNTLMQNRLDELQTITASTVTASYYGGGGEFGALSLSRRDDDGRTRCDGANVDGSPGL